MHRKSAVVEENGDWGGGMRGWLGDRFYQFEALIFTSAPNLIDFLRQNLGDTLGLSLDHDLEPPSDHRGVGPGPGTGRDVVDYLACQDPACPVIIATTNSSAAEGMEEVLREAHWQTYRVFPFDDLSWIATDWFRAMRRGILGMARGRGESADRSPRRRPS